MTEYTIHSIESAPVAAKDTLEQVQKKYSIIPNMLGIMAESPPLLNAYLSLAQLFEQSSFSPTEQQIVLLATSYENGCTYCMSVHTALAGMQNVPDNVVHAIREGRPIPDDRLEALRTFVRAVVSSRGFPTEAETSQFFSAGYGRAQVLEVLLGVGMKTLSNYTNHITDTPLDEAFKPAEWNCKHEAVGA